MREAIKRILPEKIPALGAVFYNALPARMFGPHYKKIAMEVPLEEGQTLVDVGTGPGLLPIEIAERFPRSKIIGVDLSPKMIEIARKHLERRGRLPNVEFRVVDAKKLSFPDGSVDFFISTGTMHHWKEPVLVLDELYRCLKPGGQAWIYDGYPEATDADIEASIRRFFWGLPTNGMVRRLMGIHGFSREEYDTGVRQYAQKSRFGGCAMEPRGVMMRVRLRKES